MAVADAHDIPLINLWAAFQPLPGYGIGPDRTHIRHELGAFCDFTGAEARVGGTLRNLLSLQALDLLRLRVLDAAPLARISLTQDKSQIKNNSSWTYPQLIVHMP